MQVPDEPNIHVSWNKSKPDPDGFEGDERMLLDSYEESEQNHIEPERHEQLDPNDLGVYPVEPNLNGVFDRRVTILESELDNAEADPDHPRDQNAKPPDQMDFTSFPSIELPSHVNSTPGEPHPKESRVEEMQTEPDSSGSPPRSQSTEPVPDDPELRIIQDPVTVLCGRLQSATQSLKNEATPSETGRVIQTLIKIIGYDWDLTFVYFYTIGRLLLCSHALKNQRDVLFNGVQQCN